MGTFQAKGRVDPRRQTAYVMVLGMIPLVVLFLFMIGFELMFGIWGGDILVEKYIILPLPSLPIIIPFIRIGKTIKAIKYVIPLLAASLALAALYIIIFLPPAFVGLIVIPMFAGRSMTKWSRQWNEGTLQGVKV